MRPSTSLETVGALNPLSLATSARETFFVFRIRLRTAILLSLLMYRALRGGVGEGSEAFMVTLAPCLRP
jgi:hypothetical protein